MRSDKLFDAIGDINDDMIISSLKTPKKAPKTKYFTIIAAACLCAVLLIIPAVLMLRQNKGDFNASDKSHSGILNESPLSPAGDEPTIDNSDSSSKNENSTSQNKGDGATELPQQAPGESSGDSSVSSPSYDLTAISAEVIGKIIKITYRGGSESYTESTYTDNTVYNKGIFITDITWDGEMCKIYSIQEKPDASLIMLISPSGNVKIFKSSKS